MKKWFSFFLACLIVMSLTACSQDTNNKGDAEDDGMVTVYLVTSATSYEADGSKGYRQVTCSYNEKGLPTSISYDIGPQETLYDPELDCYIVSYGAFDGVIETERIYEYNEQGHCHYYCENSNGDILNGQRGYTYHYDADGRIESVDIPDYVTQEAASVQHYCYNENGQLVEIYTENLSTGIIQWQYDFRFDEKGRIVKLASRRPDACTVVEYTYNDDDQLTMIATYTGMSQVPLDDQHVSQSSTANTLNELKLSKSIEFEYDKNGNLVQRRIDDDICEYVYDVAGNLQSVICNGETDVVYVTDEKDADSSAYTFVKDKNGNVIKQIYTDGSYTEYTYQKFQLTEAEAIRCNNIYNQIMFEHVFVYSYFYPLSFRANSGFYDYLPEIPMPLADMEIFRHHL